LIQRLERDAVAGDGLKASFGERQERDKKASLFKEKCSGFGCRMSRPTVERNATHPQARSSLEGARGRLTNSRFYSVFVIDLCSADRVWTDTGTDRQVKTGRGNEKAGRMLDYVLEERSADLGEWYVLSHDILDTKARGKVIVLDVKNSIMCKQLQL
jgi:hypothetical protein